MSFVRVYKDHVGNEEVRAKIKQAIGPHEDLLTIVKRRKVQWYVSRSSGLAKAILQGTGKGEEDKADRGRVGKKTSGNGQALSSPSPRGQWRTGEKRRKMVAKSWCPNDSHDDDDDGDDGKFMVDSSPCSLGLLTTSVTLSPFESCEPMLHSERFPLVLLITVFFFISWCLVH